MNLDTLDNSRFARIWRRVMKSVWIRLAVAATVFCIAFVAITFVLPLLVPALAYSFAVMPLVDVPGY